jgi:hypothetical protein
MSLTSFKVFTSWSIFIGQSMTQQINFINTFCGSNSEVFLRRDNIIVNKIPQLILDKKNINLEVGHIGEHHYFFFKDDYGRIFRLHLYTLGDYVTGEIRLKTGFKEYELICILRNEDNNLNIGWLKNLPQSIKYFEHYFEELLE